MSCFRHDHGSKYLSVSWTLRQGFKCKMFVQEIEETLVKKEEAGKCGRGGKAASTIIKQSTVVGGSPAYSLRKTLENSKEHTELSHPEGKETGYLNANSCVISCSWR